jgi:hypothetical protein
MKYPPKQSTINYRKIEKLQKLFPQGIVFDGVDLIKIIEKQNCLLHEFRHMGNINPRDTSVRSSEIWQLIRDCYE